VNGFSAFRQLMMIDVQYLAAAFSTSGIFWLMLFTIRRPAFVIACVTMCLSPVIIHVMKIESAGVSMHSGIDAFHNRLKYSNSTNGSI
jgi:hypothetical protein